MLNGLFRNYSDRERLPLVAQIAVIAVVLLFFGLTIEIDKTMTCKNQYSYCTVESHNFFRIKKSKRLFIPKKVSYVNIESYEKTVRRRKYYNREETRYKVNLVDNNGNKSPVFENYIATWQAEKSRDLIQKCIEQGPYPCMVKE